MKILNSSRTTYFYVWAVYSTVLLIDFCSNVISVAKECSVLYYVAEMVASCKIWKTGKVKKLQELVINLFQHGCLYICICPVIVIIHTHSSQLTSSLQSTPDTVITLSSQLTPHIFTSNMTSLSSQWVSSHLATYRVKWNYLKLRRSSTKKS